MWNDQTIQELNFGCFGNPDESYNQGYTPRMIPEYYFPDSSGLDINIKVEERFPNISLTNNGNISNLNINSSNYPTEININQVDEVDYRYTFPVKMELLDNLPLTSASNTPATMSTTNNWKEEKKELHRLKGNLKALVRKTMKDVAICFEEVKLQMDDYIEKEKKVLVMSLNELELTIEEKLYTDDEVSEILRKMEETRGRTIKFFQDFRIIN
jgi:hypothetical protein